MAKSQNQKLKLLYILKILHERTNENNAISTHEIIELLEKQEILAERKSIYNDIEQLISFGIDIVSNKSKINGGYFLASRDFELAELKLLVDAVQATKFITEKKSKVLISKLESLTSIYDAKQLQRHVYVANRVKTTNENIYYNVDYIHRSISQNSMIGFRYFEWTIDKEMKFKKKGTFYHISPWALTFSEENYYLIGFEEESNMIKHYRVDKMIDMKVIGTIRLGKEQFEKFDIGSYTNKTFGMFGGTEELVTLNFPNRLVGVVFDRFGKETTIRKRDENNFSIRVNVAVSPQFYGWLTGIGPEVRISAPESVKESYYKYLCEIIKG